MWLYTAGHNALIHIVVDLEWRHPADSQAKLPLRTMTVHHIVTYLQLSEQEQIVMKCFDQKHKA